MAKTFVPPAELVAFGPGPTEFSPEGGGLASGNCACPFKFFFFRNERYLELSFAYDF